MFDKSIILNLKLASKEFGIGLMISAFSVFLISIGGFLSLTAIAGFLAAFIFFVMGFIKLFYKSLFLNNAYPYIDLPISNIQIVLGKVFVGTFWLSLLICLLIIPLLSFIMQGENFFHIIIGSFLLKGIPVEKTGFLIVVLFWSFFLGIALFSSISLFSIILANTLGIRRFKIPTIFFVFILTFTVTGSISYAINKWLNLDPDTLSNALGLNLCGLAVTIALLAFFIFMSEKLLTKKYNLSDF